MTKLSYYLRNIIMYYYYIIFISILNYYYNARLSAGLICYHYNACNHHYHNTPNTSTLSTLYLDSTRLLSISHHASSSLAPSLPYIHHLRSLLSSLPFHVSSLLPPLPALNFYTRPFNQP